MYEFPYDTITTMMEYFVNKNLDYTKKMNKVNYIGVHEEVE